MSAHHYEQELAATEAALATEQDPRQRERLEGDKLRLISLLQHLRNGPQTRRHLPCKLKDGAASQAECAEPKHPAGELL